MSLVDWFFITIALCTVVWGLTNRSALRDFEALECQIESLEQVVDDHADTAQRRIDEAVAVESEAFRHFLRNEQAVNWCSVCNKIIDQPMICHSCGTHGVIHSAVVITASAAEDFLCARTNPPADDQGSNK